MGLLRSLKNLVLTRSCVCGEGEGGGHSGPGCGRINWSKLTKSASKCIVISLTIALPETGFFFDDSPKKFDFWPFLLFFLSPY